MKPAVSETLIRLIVAPVAALVAASSTFFFLFFLLIPFERFDSDPVVFHGLRFVARLGEGFVFVFVGSLVAGPRRPIMLGVGLFIYLHTYSSDGFPTWHLVASTIGGLAAVGIRAMKREKAGAES